MSDSEDEFFDAYMCEEDIAALESPEPSQKLVQSLETFEEQEEKREEQEQQEQEQEEGSVIFADLPTSTFLSDKALRRQRCDYLGITITLLEEHKTMFKHFIRGEFDQNPNYLQEWWKGVKGGCAPYIPGPGPRPWA